MFDKTEYLKKYAEQDHRLQSQTTMTELQANNAGISFERLMNVGRGVREIHTINVYGTNIPIRVLSMKEERDCKHAVYNDMKKFPNFKPDTDDYKIEFNKTLFRKMISLATSSCPETPGDSFYTEDDLEAIPSTTFADLLNKYRAFELEYNPEINDLDEIEIRALIGELRDQTKKYQLLTGMTLSQLRGVTSTLLEMISGQEDSLHLSSLLEESEMTKTNVLA